MAFKSSRKAHAVRPRAQTGRGCCVTATTAEEPYKE